MPSSSRPRARIDRVIAASALAISAAVVLATLVALPRGALEGRVDLGALADLAARLSRADAAQYRATYEVRRHGPGPSSIATVTEMRFRGVDVVASSETLTMRVDGRAFTCTRTEEGARCLEQGTPSDPIPTAAVVAEAVASGRYELARRAGREIAGETAACFRLHSAGSAPLAVFGETFDWCLDDDGITRFSRRDAGAVIDEREVVDVDHDLESTDIDEIFDGFDTEVTELAAPDA